MNIHPFYVRVGARGKAALHTHDNHEWYLCLDGGCTQLAGDAQFDMSPGDLCLLPQGVPHFAYAHNGNGSGAWVVNVQDSFLAPRLDGDREANIILRTFCDRACRGQYLFPLTATGRALIRTAFKTMVDEFTEQKAGWLASIKAEWTRLLIGLYRNWPQGSRPEAPLPRRNRQERMREVLAYIDDNYMIPLMVEDLLRLAHLSRSHFHAVFAEETGTTFIDYLNRIRTAQAKRLLQESSLPIAQIALGCGFSSLSHFYAVFRQHSGFAPREYRASCSPTDAQ